MVGSTTCCRTRHRKSYTRRPLPPGSSSCRTIGSSTIASWLAMVRSRPSGVKRRDDGGSRSPRLASALRRLARKNPRRMEMARRSASVRVERGAVFDGGARGALAPDACAAGAGAGSADHVVTAVLADGAAVELRAFLVTRAARLRRRAIVDRRLMQLAGWRPVAIQIPRRRRGPIATSAPEQRQQCKAPPSQLEPEVLHQ